MSTPFQDMPQLRATFEADMASLLQLATQQLAGLTRTGSDFSLSPALRKTVHSMRGASAMVGAQALTAIADDYERLIEVAESFKLTAADRAREAFAFLQGQFSSILAAVKATLAGREDEAKRYSELVHQKATATWGAYFYPVLHENGGGAPHSKPEVKAGQKPVRPPGKANGGYRSNADSVVREFLTSLGVAPGPGVGPEAGLVEMPAEQIDPEMLSYFVLETNDSLMQLEGLLLGWEKSPADGKIAQSVFRLTHTIKGAANSLGLVRIGKLLHGLEDLLETHVVDRVFPRLTELVEVILGVADTVKALVREAQTGTIEAANTTRISALVERIQMMAASPAAPARSDTVEVRTPSMQGLEAARLRKESPASTASPENTSTSGSEVAMPDSPDRLDQQTIRVDSDRLDLLMNLIGELVISRSRLEKKLSDISRLKEEMLFGRSRLFQSITDFQGKYEYSRPQAEVNRLATMDANQKTGPALTGRPRVTGGAENGLSGFSELEFDQYDDFNILARTLMEIGTDTGEIFSQLNRFFDAFGEETNQFSKITTRLQDEITRVRMMPLTLLFQRLQRAARDAARKESKEIEFITVDNDTRLDKLILDRLYTPLLHIVRNAVSHGLESVEGRQAAGKSATGQIRLHASCEANQVVIEVVDDGRGLDLAAIRSTAIQRGLLAPDAVVDDDTLTQFIFYPGFSTAATVTDVSGRGVGLDVVRQEIARLSGSIQVRSSRGESCAFVIHLPLTLAINQAMFITAGGETCALPLNFVERVQEGNVQDITVSGQHELVRTPEGLVPLVRLGRLLDVPVSGASKAVVLARVGNQRVAIGVDRILRKQDIVVKPLGPLLQGHPLFSGATLGGDGQVVLIVDLPRLLETEHTSMVSEEASVGDDKATPETAHSVRNTILVVDDSLSVRKVIEKHLHSLQFKVELAVDGLDALEKLRTGRIQLVLTDLEMPRMHGFELIAEMRRQEIFRRVPIVVVTSRDAEKHRRRATALGANDYIIKPFSREQLAKHINHQLANVAQ